MAVDQPLRPSHRVLVINPNTCTALTESFEPTLSAIQLSQDIELSYWTCPPGGPAMVKSLADMHDSAIRCLPPILQLADGYDGFLAACYADHPLVQLLQSRVGNKPVVCIFHASILAAMQLAGQSTTARFGIVTTAPIYENFLTNAVRALFRSNEQSLARFAGVSASGISLAEVRFEEQQTKATWTKIMTATANLLRSDKDVEVICMGGAILAGMEHWVHKACEAEGKPHVKVLDQLAAGILTLDRLLGEESLLTVDYRQALK